MQADNLRQQTLHQLREILTTRQATRCLLAIGEYYRRLRALSSVWATRPREYSLSPSLLLVGDVVIVLVNFQNTLVSLCVSWPLDFSGLKKLTGIIIRKSLTCGT
jgi:hypothetical protein